MYQFFRVVEIYEYIICPVKMFPLPYNDRNQKFFFIQNSWQSWILLKIFAYLRATGSVG